MVTLKQAMGKVTVATTALTKAMTDQVAADKVLVTVNAESTKATAAMNAAAKLQMMAEEVVKTTMAALVKTMTEQVAAEKLGADKQKLANAAKLALETLVNKAAEEGLPAIPKFRPRELLAKDLTAKDNLLFARSSVNRIWFLLMGRGLFHPLDQMHGKNPPVQPELLDELVRDFIAHGFDLKRMVAQPGG